jgi:glycosyltransferase involved in cell wall biosynthesis
MQFSIVTPSFQNSQWLRLCVASVADQQGVEFEHIIQDGCSDDGTKEWLLHDKRVRAFIEKDLGMYDAINRGYRRAEGEIFAHLNCDEQYLPNALQEVAAFFAKNPQIDVVLAGTIVVDREGEYVCHRHAMVPKSSHIWFRFPVLTSSLFLRRRVIRDRGIFFDPRWRDLGDLHWMRALLRQKVSIAVFNHFTSSFSDTGENMNLKPNALRERSETLAMAPRWDRLMKPALILHHRLRRIAAGHFFLRPTKYSIYTIESPSRRVEFNVSKPTAVWWNRYSTPRNSIRSSSHRPA